MADLTPNNREEYWLKGMVDGQTTLEPNKRREYWYKEIVDAIGSGGGGGTGGGVLIIGMTAEARTLTLNKTWQEIYDHMSAGGLAMVLAESIDADEASVSHMIIKNCEGIPNDSEYFVNFVESTFPQFSATSPSSYPTSTTK